MPLFNKLDKIFPKSESVTVNGNSYSPDYIIDLPLDEDDKIDIENCNCVFSTKNPNSPLFRKYVGAKFFKKFVNNNVLEKVNGYLPESVFCFQETDFPLDDFIKEQNFKYFGEA